MKYDEFKRQVGRAGLTITEFASLLGRSRESVTNYGVAGEVPDHIAVVVVLMAELADARVDFRPAITRIGLVKKRGRGRSFGAARDEQ